MRHLRRVWLCAVLLILTLSACSPAVASAPTDTLPPVATVTQTSASTTPEPSQTPVAFALSSPAFEANTVIPDRFSCKDEDISPELTWTDPPIGTQSLALVFDDPNNAGGGWVHWVVFNIPPEVRGLPEAVIAGEQVSSGGLHGANSWGELGYGGPCPPPGTTHQYVFRLYALSSMLDLEAGATKGELLEAIESQILSEVSLVADFTR